MADILSVFSYSFMTNAFVGGTLISICAALLGVILVLKRYSMIGDGLSHVGFGAMSIATVLGLSPLWIAVPVVTVSALLLMRMNSSAKIKGDAAIGLISTGALTIGIIVVSSAGVNTDLNSYLFGSILSLSKTDMILCIVTSLTVVSLFAVLYNKIFSVTFDESFAKTSGINVDFYNSVVAVLSAITIVLGMRMMGTLLISSIIIFPAITAMRIFKSFKTVCISAVIIAVFCFVSGLLISFVYSTPAGATVVAVNIVLFFIAWILGAITERI